MFFDFMFCAVALLAAVDVCLCVLCPALVEELFVLLLPCLLPGGLCLWQPLQAEVHAPSCHFARSCLGSRRSHFACTAALRGTSCACTHVLLLLLIELAPLIAYTPISTPRSAIPQAGGRAGFCGRQRPRHPAGGPAGQSVDHDRAAAAGGCQGARVNAAEQVGSSWQSAAGGAAGGPVMRGAVVLLTLHHVNFIATQSPQP